MSADEQAAHRCADFGRAHPRREFVEQGERDGRGRHDAVAVDRIDQLVRALLLLDGRLALDRRGRRGA